MIFGDEARGIHLASCGDGLTAMVNQTKTEAHLGPGAYFVEQNESIRGGWSKRTFSKREPMSPSTRRTDRSHHYTSGVMMPSGSIAISASNLLSSPGPGHYLGPQTSFGARSSPSKMSSTGNLSMSSGSRPQSAGNTLGTSPSKRGSLMSPGSPRLASPHSFVRDGILFHSKPGTDSGVGPGYYAPVTSTLVTKSFNSRVSKKKTPPSKSSTPSARSPASDRGVVGVGGESSFTSLPFEAF